MEKIKNLSVGELIGSGKFKVFFFGLVALILALTIFQAGVFVGLRKAEFSYGLGDNYYKTFGFEGRERGVGRMGMMGRGGMFGGFNQGELTEGNGVAGKIISINLPDIVVEGVDGVEKSVLLNKDISIREFHNTIQSSELKIGDFVVVIGAPNSDSKIEAKFIRVMPPMMNGGLGVFGASTNTSATLSSTTKK